MKAPTTLAKLLLIAVVATIATTGCATTGNLSSRAVSPDEQTTISIRNYNWSDVKVYLVPASGGSPVRIGTVGSLATERIPVRGSIRRELQAHGRLQFLIKPLASSTSYVTHSVVPGPRRRVASHRGEPIDTFDPCAGESIALDLHPAVDHTPGHDRAKLSRACRVCRSVRKQCQTGSSNSRLNAVIGSTHLARIPGTSDLGFALKGVSIVQR